MLASHPNESHANAVDYSLIEPSKENIQPLRNGRNPVALLKAVEKMNKPVVGNSKAATTEAEDSAAIKAQRKTYEAAIKAAATATSTTSSSNTNPLSPWLSYISWTQQTYLNSSNLSSHLIPLLEKCTRTFLTHPEIKHTLKFLQVWFLYIDSLPEPLEIFAFLKQNEVGVKHAVFWEGWSRTLEGKERLDEAIQVLQLGINYGATPVSQLKNAQKRLEARVAKKISASVASGDVANNASTSTGASSSSIQHAANVLASSHGLVARQPLSRISSSTGAGGSTARVGEVDRTVNGQTTYANNNSSDTFGPRAASKPKSVAASTTATYSNGTNFQIFCDDMQAALPATTGTATTSKQPFGSLLGNTAAASSSSSTGPAPSQWREYAPAHQIEKENRLAPSTWSAPLHAAPATAASTVEEGTILTLPTPTITSDFAVFCDAECAAEEEEARKRQKEQAGVRAKLDGAALKATNMEKGAAATTTKLFANPLRNMKAADSSSSSSSSSSTSAAKPQA